MLPRGDRRLLPALVALCSLILVAGATAAVVRSRGDDGRARSGRQVSAAGHPATSTLAPPPPTTAAGVGDPQAATEAPAATEPEPSQMPAAPAFLPGQSAVVDVAVANLWAGPDLARGLDEPSLGKPVDMRGWLASMDVGEREWLTDRLVTQALYGDRVTVLEAAGEWARVAVARQPSSLDPRGYPGWLPAGQLAAQAGAGGGDDAVVVESTSVLHDPAQAANALMELSYNTRLPALDAGPQWVTVATPGGGQGRPGDLLFYATDEGRGPDPPCRDVCRRRADGPVAGDG